MRKLILTLLLVTACFSNSLEEILSSKTIRIGLDTDTPPFSSLNSNGQFVGFEAEFAKKLGVAILGDNANIELIPVKYSDRISYLEDNKVDIIINTFSKTKEREKRIDFAMPYFAVAKGLLVPSDSNYTKLSQLNNKTIIAVKGHTSSLYFKKQGFNVVEFDTSGECYKALKEGKGDAYANDNLTVLAYPVIDSEVEVPKTLRNIGTPELLCPATSKGNKDLINEINKHMIEFSKEKFFKKIFNEYFIPFYKTEFNSDGYLLEEIYRVFG